MTSRIVLATVTAAAAALLATPPRLHAQQPAAGSQHEQHQSHPAPSPDGGSAAQHQHGAHAGGGMMAQKRAADARVNALVKKVQDATGAAKVDALAELVTALVETREMCGPMMTEMMSAQTTKGDHQHGAESTTP